MKKGFLLVILFAMIISTSRAEALGECGLSCCLAGAVSGGGALAENFGVSFQYEYSYMKSIRRGGNDVSHSNALNDNWTMGSSYAVPTEMVMEKFNMIGIYPVTERFQLLGIVPYIKNNMNMQMKSSMGMLMNMKMDQVDGLGDISLLGLYTAYQDAPIKPESRLTVGLGLKTATGKNDERTSSGTMVHAMMQPGSGSWDPLFMVNYMRAFYPLVLQANLFYHLTTTGDEGYEYGNQFTYDLIARIQAFDYVNVGLEINGIHAGQDTDHDGKYTRSTMLDNVANTGLDSIFISPTLQFKIPDTKGSIDFKYQTPIYQNVKGYQQVLDWRILTSISWAF